MDSAAENLTWNAKLKSFIENNDKSLTELAREYGIGNSTLRDYTSEKVTDLDKVSKTSRYKLYLMTGYDEFRFEGIDDFEPQEKPIQATHSSSDHSSELAEDYRDKRNHLERTVDDNARNMDGHEKFESGLLKAQRYHPSAQERAEAIMELLDIACEEIDYFRTATSEEKDLLVEKLKENPDSFSYLSQMLNVIYSGKNMDSWMLFSQPPSKLRRIQK